MYLGIWEGEVNESLPRSLPGGLSTRPYACCYLHPQYTPSLLVAYSAHALWKGLDVVDDGNFGLVAMADATTILSISTLHKTFTAVDISAKASLCENMWVRAVGQVSQSTEINSYFQEAATVRALGIQRRLNPATPYTVPDCISQQLNLRLHPMLYSQSQRPSHPF